jgi:hypothetical protein
VNYARIFIATAALSTGIDAAESDMAKLVDPRAPLSYLDVYDMNASQDKIPGDEHLILLGNASAHINSIELADFITPIANDLRFGYSAHIGNYHRKQEYGENTSSNFQEHGLWLSYTRALSGSARVLSGQAEWRAETALLASRADVTNPNGSSGKLDVGSINLGIGPAWALFANARNRLEIELLPFLGIGLARYENSYISHSGNLMATTTIEASGLCFEYGIKANLMWCWSNGWGAAMHIGYVQRQIDLKGDSLNHWGNGTDITRDYTSDDTLYGLRYGIFLARRF